MTATSTMRHTPFDIIPFQFLSSKDRAFMLEAAWADDARAGERLITQGGDGRDVFLLTSGTVEVIDTSVVPPARVSLIAEGHYFGERASLFEQPRMFEVVAHTDVAFHRLDGDTFIALLRRSPTFAAALGRILRDKQGIFAPIDRFLTQLSSASASGRIDLGELMPLYRELQPAIHTLVNADTIDFGALIYAVRRLPENVSRCLAWFLTDDLLFWTRPSESIFTSIETDARRRTIFQMLEGKNLVLVRDGISDVVDLVTCLCVYTIEARKIRQRLKAPEVLLPLYRTDAGADDAMLEQLPFTEDERAGLRAVWPGDNLQRLREMVFHHEDFSLYVHKQADNYNSAHAERWTHQLADATETLLGLAPHELDEDFPVHIISSNTHSVANCLSTFIAEREEAILDWGETHRPQLAGLPLRNRRDRVVVLARDYLEAHPHLDRERQRVDRLGGVLELDNTAFTGIAVHLIDLSSVPPGSIDPAIGRGEGPQVGLVVNIDYAFGQQAEGIIANLISLFGRRIRSINILGKAGALLGERGDVMVARSFVEQVEDRQLCPPVTVDLERLEARLPDRSIHVGAVLTVIGTLPQNRNLLMFYARIWGCVGLEMEGSYYCNVILQARERGILREDVALAFLYYASDLPLNAHSTLATGMSPMEGIPPLYAITREILTTILEG